MIVRIYRISHQAMKHTYQSLDLDGRQRRIVFAVGNFISMPLVSLRFVRAKDNGRCDDVKANLLRHIGKVWLIRLQ